MHKEEYGFFYIFSIEHSMLFAEDMKAIKQSKGRLMLNPNTLERCCSFKFGVSRDVKTLYGRMLSHQNGYPPESLPSIKLFCALYVPNPYEAESHFKSTYVNGLKGGEWLTQDQINEILR
jgi:hypothetical protein